MVHKPEGSQTNMPDDKRIDFVVATIHELTTSLTAIIASADLLADELELDQKSALGRLTQGIVRNAYKMNEGLSSLSKATRFLFRDIELNPEYLSLGQAIQDAAAQVYPITQGKRQSLVLDVPDSLPMLKADKQHLEQILLNLLTNASKFTPEGGQLKVTARRDGSSLVTEVSDTGNGIPPQEYERIFQPYYQPERDRGKKHAGSGLGLSIRY